MKKMNNKGFSLVELIIVIAIMAILAGAIAPALIRYIDKSRKSNDVSAAKTIKTAVETAMSNEGTYELLTTFPTTGGTDYGIAATAMADGTVDIQASSRMVIAAGEETDGITATDFAFNYNYAESDASTLEADARKQIAKNIGEKTPKVKYKKDAKEKDDDGAYISGTDCSWVVYISQGGSVVTGLGNGTTKFYQLAPEVSKNYQ